MCGCNSNINHYTGMGNPINLKSLILQDWVQVDGLLLHPNDPRLKDPKDYTPEEVRRSVMINDGKRIYEFQNELMDQAAEQKQAAAIQEQKIMQTNTLSSNTDSNLKTYGVAALLFGAILFVGKKMKGSKKPRKVDL